MKCIAVLVATGILALGQRPIPPAGITLTPEQKAPLEAGLKSLSAKIDRLRGSALLPDVLIFREAVRYALEYNEFFRADELDKARQLLRTGDERAEALLNGAAPWTTATGLVPRGYISKIDRSVQPYGLYLPASFSPALARRWRLDTWFHGRGETLSEVNFLHGGMTNAGEFTPPDTIVLFLYGRYCNANKFAGEVDLFEALADVKKRYRIDENRIVIRGFSMGGAAAWQFAVHHAGEWAAAAPGAGFAESEEFLRIPKAQLDAMPAWQKKLFHLYNSTDYAANLYNLPTVAYSGEIDGQRQAASVMARALEAEGMTLAHIIGPNTPHRYHPDSKVLINERLDAIAERGRDPYPRKIRFTTFTLAYNRMKWVRLDGLEKHWDRARLDAEVTAPGAIRATTSNVSAFTFDMGFGAPLLETASKINVTIDDQNVAVPGPATDRSWTPHFVKRNGRWAAGELENGLRKRTGLQGPIDDAFMDSFIFVKPSGTPQPWVVAEMERAIREWRRHFRGDAQVKLDTEITDADIASSNIVLWGDPASNKFLARIADRIPAKWTEGRVPVMIYPNPLNPKRYVVLNSGFTFSEEDYLNNARQIPRLPDWAYKGADGKVAEAGFFDETWK